MGLGIFRHRPAREWFTAKLEMALSQGGCPICRLAAEREQSTLWAILWEQVNDPILRRQLRATLGFCSAHLYALARLARDSLHDLLGISILLADWLQEACRRLERGTAPAPSPQRCPQCARNAKVAKDFLQRLLGNLQGPSWAQQWAPTLRLCLNHNRLALAWAPRDLHGLLLHREREGLLSLARRLEETEGTEGEPGALAEAQAHFFGRPQAPPPPGPRLGCPQCALQAEEARALALGLRPYRVEWPPCPRHLPMVPPERRIACYIRAVRLLLEGSPPPPTGRRRRPREDRASLGRCPVCSGLQEGEARRYASFWQADGEGTLCLPHTAGLVAASPERARALELLRRQAGHTRALAKELGEFVRKSDWQYRHEPLGDEERTAWLRALHLLAGDPP